MNTLEGMRIVCTYECNKRCNFCYQDSHDSVFLEVEKFKTILKSLDFLPIYLTFQGGELSLYPEKTFQLIEAAHTIFPQVFRKSITSNGTADISFYEQSILYGITHFTFSLHNLKDNTLLEKILYLKNNGFCSVRVNTFLDKDDIETAIEVLKWCIQNKIQLTLCEDLRLSENNINTAKIICDKLNDSYTYRYYKHQYVLRSFEDNYTFWIYRHLNHYDYNNLIVLPNGEQTITFDDVQLCKGKN